MHFQNSLKLLMENFKHVYKLLLAKIIIGLVAIALCAAFVLPELMHFWNSTQVQVLVEHGKEFFKSVLSGDSNGMNAVKEAIFGKGGSLSQVISLLSSMTLEIVLTIIGCAVVYLLRRFAETVCHFTTGSMLNDKMGSYAETGYWAAFVSNLGKASVYSVVYVPIVFAFDLIILLIAYCAFSLLPILAALFFGMTAVVVLQALKLTVTSPWLPAMTVDGKGIGKAMRGEGKEMRKKKFKMFSGYLVAVYLIVVVNVAAALFSFGSALLITVPASYFLLICMQYVNYYTIKGKKYFLTYEQIESNPDRGDSEHFFEYLEENKEPTVVETDEIKE